MPLLRRLVRPHGLAAPTLAALALVLVVVSGTFGALLLGVRDFQAESDSTQRAERVLTSSSELERHVVDVETGLRGALLTRDPYFLDPMRTAIATLPADLRELRDLVVDPLQERRTLALGVAVDRYVREYAQPLSRRVGRLSQARLVDVTLDGRRRLDALRARFAEFERAEERLLLGRRARAEARGRRSVVLAAGGLGLSALLLLALGGYLRRSILLPVRTVALAADELAHGDGGAAVPEAGRGEISQLARTFNAMTTALRAREAELRETGDRLQGILDHATATIAVKDLAGRYLLVNRAWEQLTGIAAGDALGRTDAELLDPEVAREAREDELRVLRWGRAVETERHIAGRTFLRVKFPLRHGDGRVHAIGVLSTDITDRERALEEARAASRAKSEFLANMSHEIRTPLNGVIGMTDLLLGTELTPEQHEFARIAASSGHALLDVINDILDFSKIEAGRLELDEEDFGVRDVVEDVAGMLAPQAHRKGLELLAVVADEVPARVRGDRGRLRQVLTNLVANAVKFTEAGEVGVRVGVVRADAQEAVLHVEVTDTGIGIAPGALERVFSSFAQADSSTTRRFGGTGLGLAISRQLVELMGGSVDVSSTLGVGSTFTFTARLAVAAPAPAPVPGGPDGPAGLRALVVDDNPANRVILAAHLRAGGLEPVLAADAPAALALLREAQAAGAPFGLVLLDHHMPGMGGLELAQAVRADHALRATPLVMLTSAGDDPGRARAAGVAHHLTKPVRRARLLEVVAAVTGAKAAREEAVPAEPAPRGGEPVLVVEDNAVNQRVVERLLGRRGLDVDLAGDGAQALEQLGRRAYSLVFMDCQMPVLDGYEATRRMRASGAPWADTPVVALTANALEGDRKRCEEAGMDDYLSKPVRAEQLDAVLDRWLGGRGAAAA